MHAIADTLITRKISAKTVMSQLGEYQTQLNDVRQRVDKTRQVLEGEILKRQQMRRDFDTIRTWIVKIEILISTRVTRNEPMDERELKVRLLSSLIITYCNDGLFFLKGELAHIVPL